MKKISVITVLVFAMVLAIGPVFAAINFKDVPTNAWYKADLNEVAQDSRKIISGFPDGTFRANEPFTVAQLATCVVRTSYYKDLKSANSNDPWYKVYVDQAKELKYILSGEFTDKDNNRAITRGEMARMIVRVNENLFGVQTYRDASKIKSLIKDYNSIPAHLRDDIVKVYDLKIIGGFPDGNFKANEPFNRAQAVTVMNKLIKPEKRINATVDALFEATPGVEIKTSNFYKINPDMPEELYKYAYREDSAYGAKLKTNKMLVETWGIVNVTEWMNIAKGYMENFYNVDYKIYNKSSYINTLKWYFTPQITWIADDRVERPIEDHIQYWADSIEKKQISITTQFVTDPSLVYAIDDVVIRGKLLYQVNSCNDMNWLKTYTKLGDVELGKQYTCIFEVVIANYARVEGWEAASQTLCNEVIITEITEVK